MFTHFRKRFLRAATVAVTGFAVAAQPALAVQPTRATHEYRIPLNPSPGEVSAHITYSHTAYDFGAVPVGGTQAQVITASNTGTARVVLSDIRAAGNSFSQSSDCGPVLNPGESCNITAGFSPTVTGPASGTVTVRSDDAVPARVIALTGRGAAGTLSATGYTFPEPRQVSADILERDIEVVNIGAAPVAVSGISMVAGADSFGQSNNCFMILAPGGRCNVRVSFSPSAPGTRTGVVAVVSDSDESPLLIPLEGEGRSATGRLTATPVGAVQIGETVDTTVTLTNDGVGFLSVTGVGVSGDDYAEGAASTCPSTVAPGASCTFGVQFTPTVVGPRVGVASASTGAGVLTATLDGVGQVASANLTIEPFGDVDVGAMQARVARLSNAGIAAITLQPPTISGEGYLLNGTTCASSLASSASCDINVTLAPATVGAKAGTLSIDTSAGLKSVSLNGAALAPHLVVAPETASFGGRALGTTTNSELLTVTNQGTQAASGMVFDLPAGYTLAPGATCAVGGSLAAGANCTFTLRFQPVATGSHTGTVRVSTAAAGGSSASLAVSGNGIRGLAAVSPTALNFGAQQAGTTSAAQAITVANNGTDTMTVTGVSVIAGEADFGQSNNCATVPVGASCTINVAFTPSAAGSRTGTLALVHDGDGVTTISLSGDGRAPAASLSAIAFPDTPVGESRQAIATLRNTGVGPLSVTAPGAGAVSGARFNFVSADCPASLAVNATCELVVRFQPTSFTPVTGQLTVVTQAGPQTAALSGTGLQASLALTYAHGQADWGATQVNETRGSEVFTVTNHGNLVATGLQFQVSQPWARYGDSCSTTLSAGASCTFQLNFSPTELTAYQGNVSVSAPNSPTVPSVPLQGQGVAPAAALSAPSFSATSVGSSSSAVATLANSGVGPLAVTIPSSSAVSGQDFTFLATNCPATLAVGASCGITVRFSPTSVDPSSGSLSVGTSAGTKTVVLGSTGIQGYATINPSALSFPVQQTATTSAVRSVTVTNTGTDTLTFVGVGVSTGASDFGQSNNCGAVAPGGTCTVNVSFTPSVAGSRAGTLSFVHNGGGMAHVSLSGEALDASATITSNAWGQMQVGSTNTNGAQFITNTGSLPIALAGTPTVNAPFSYVGNNCPASLAVGATCRVSLHFSPTAAQTYTQTLTVPTSAGTLVSTSTGQGVAASLVAISPASLGTNLPPNTMSGIHQYFENRGIGPVTVTGAPYASGQVLIYTEVGYHGYYYCTPGLVLQPGERCAVYTYISQGPGSYSGSVRVPSTAGTIEQAVSGSVTWGLVVEGVSFGEVERGSYADAELVVNNLAVTPVSGLTISAAAPFHVISNGCGSTIAPGGWCPVTVRFAPTAGGMYAGSFLTVTASQARLTNGVLTGAFDGPSTVYGELDGFAIGAALTHQPRSLDFGNVQVGQSKTLPFTLTNTGNVRANGLTGGGGAGYVITGDGSATSCGSTLAAGATCTALATLTPTAALAYNTSYWSSGSNASADYMALTGTGTAPSLVHTGYMHGGNAIMGVVGRYSNSGRWPTFTNQGSGPVTLQSHTATGGFWAWTGDASEPYCYMGKTLAAGQSCTLFVGINAEVGNYGGDSYLTYSAPGIGSSFVVEGGWMAQVATTTTNTSTVNFGTTAQGGWTAGQTVRLTNAATSNPLRNVSVSIGGAHASNFRINSNGCAAGVPAGGSCDIVVAFNPTWGANGFSGTLQVSGIYPRMEPGETTHVEGSTPLYLSVALAGNGGFDQPTLLTAAEADFGTTWFGTAPSQHHWQFRNDGNMPMTLQSPSLALPLSVHHNDCTNVAPGATCSLGVTNSWNSDAPMFSQTFTLTGTGVAPAALTARYRVLSAVPVFGTTALAFGSVNVGSSATQYVTLFNYGAQNAYNWAANNGVSNLPQGFSFDLSGCSAVAPGAGSGSQGGSCTVAVTFTPPAVGNYGGSGVYVAAASYGLNPSGRSTWLSLSGTGVQQVGAAVTITIVPQTTRWLVTNPNAFAVTPTGVEVLGLGASMNAGGTTCQVGAPIAAGGTCTVWANIPLPSCGSNYGMARVTTPAGIVNGGLIYAGSGVICP